MSLRDYYNDYYFGYANLPDTKERQKLYYKWNKERIKSNQSIWRKYNREYPKIWKKAILIISKYGIKIIERGYLKTPKNIIVIRNWCRKRRKWLVPVFNNKNLLLEPIASWEPT